MSFAGKTRGLVPGPCGTDREDVAVSDDVRLARWLSWPVRRGLATGWV
jgi:hypothetical protein